MLNELCNQLAELKKTLDLEAAERAKVIASPEYQSLAQRIEACMLQQNSMLSGAPDSRLEYEALRKRVIEEMNKEGIFAVGNVAAKWKEKSEVNKERVMTTIGGDIDQYFTLSHVTQVKLKEFAKENPEMKKELLNCIEVVSREVVDLEIQDPLPTSSPKA